MSTPNWVRYTSVPSDFMFEVDGWLVFKDRDPMAVVPWLVVHETERRGAWFTEQHDRLIEDLRIPYHISKRVVATINLIDP